jgi:hypothetical protein
MNQSLAEQLKRGFRHLLGTDLTNVSRIGGVVLAPTPESEATLGEFRILVWDTADTPKLLLRANGADTRPNAEGIYWQEMPTDLSLDPPTWCAIKLYEMVELRWWNSERSTDTRWRRLDETVTEIVQGT